MIEAHLRRLRKRDTIDAAEERSIQRIVSETRRVPAHKTLIREGEELQHSILLIDGWLGRAVHMKTGVRQITALHVAGDFADLHGFTLKHLDHDLVALTDCIVAVVPHERLRQLTNEFPHLTRMYWFSTNVDAAVHRQWAVSLGRRNAIARMAHLFCELLLRLEVVGKTDGSSYDFPLTQDQLASCLGLTSVHVNRTLQALRRQGIIELQNKRLTVFDLPALKKIAEFDPSYLYLDRQPE
ncbi:MAG TPA: Crp/Fnr family transcriptional regulator [Burkholderiales bacterium]|nr:Crp/Fnr family transcriptional regulator [Burkholderiales bacterium]